MNYSTLNAEQCAADCVSVSAELQVFSQIKCELAEGPLWHTKRGSLLWVDILQNKLLEKNYSTGEVFSWDLPETVSSLACDASAVDSLWLVSERHLSRFNLQTGVYEPKVRLPLQENYRTNDGSVGPDGRYWFGTMLRSPEPAKGQVYSIGKEYDLRKELDGIAIPNTFCWLDNCLLLSDSLRQVCLRYDIVTSDQALLVGCFANLSDGSATPDGGAVDSDGNVWIALWGGAKVVCYSPQGLPLREIMLPVPHPSSCCFGGSDNNILFITTAREGLNDTELSMYPDSGKVFFIQLPVQGAVVHQFSVV